MVKNVETCASTAVCQVLPYFVFPKKCVMDSVLMMEMLNLICILE